MFNHKLLLQLLFTILLFSLPNFLIGQTSKGGSFNFTLKKTANTSAGVYSLDGRLIKTLWSNRKLSAGTHQETWNGVADDGTLAIQGLYKVKVLSNNVQYEWEGVIGNTSTALTGSTVLRSFMGLYDMSICGGNIYYATGYNEGWTSQYKMSLSNLQSKVAILPNRGTSQSSRFIATDNKYAYWGGSDDFQGGKNFVFATKIEDDKEVNFSDGVPFQCAIGRKYISVIDTGFYNMGGLAVQKYGRFLFVSHTSKNQIKVFDKVAGTLVNNITINLPKRLVCDTLGGLWISSGLNEVTRYTINSDGSITSSGITLSGIISPLAIAFSSKNNVLAVADGGTSQQVKLFDNTTGRFIRSIGQLGGYQNATLVENDRFYLSGPGGIKARAYLAFQADGSLWIGDAGNYRSQLFSFSGQYLNTIMYMPHSYSVTVDINNPNRVFSDYLEFEVDYSKSLKEGWKLKRNWAGKAAGTYDDQLFAGARLRNVVTLDNNRTYAIIFKGNSVYEIYELSNTGLRPTGVQMKSNYDYYSITKDGTLNNYNPDISGGFSYYKTLPLEGFDAANNPIYGDYTLLEKVPITANDPFAVNKTTVMQRTSNGAFITFDPDKPENGRGLGYHLGAVKDNAFLWRSAKATSKDYSGDFPIDGSFDIGNGVEHPGGDVYVVDSNIFWNYHGELWKAGQTNKWNHLDQNGLMIGQFGVITQDDLGIEAAGSQAGNVLTGSLVKIGDSIVYIYHNDESYHAGVHRWKVSGLNTVLIQTVDLDTTTSISREGIDLLAGLEHHTILTNKSGWNRNPISEDYTNVFRKYWSGKIGYNSLDKLSSPDLSILFRQASGNYQVNRKLDINSNAINWRLWGNLSWFGNQPNEDNGTGGSYFDVLDDQDKIITRVYTRLNIKDNVATYFLHANNGVLAQGTPAIMNLVLNYSNPFEISVDSSGATFTYANYPSITTPIFQNDANWRQPRTIRFYFWTSNPGANYSRAINILSLHFSANVDEATSNAPIAPTLLTNDDVNTLIAMSADENADILVSENNEDYTPYLGQINVGNVSREAGYWRFKVKSSAFKNESSIVYSPAFSYVPEAPTLTVDYDITTLVASHSLGISEILVSENGGIFKPYEAAIDIGSEPKPIGYWKFKVKSAKGRKESSIVSFPSLKFAPDPPTLVADDKNDFLTATHPLGVSEILVSFNNGPYTSYAGFGRIYVGDYARPKGYWKFKIRSATQRNESTIVESPVFTYTPKPPVLTTDDVANTLSADHALGVSEILVSENDGEFKQYEKINVGNIQRPAGYWKFKVKSADGRSESAVVNSPAFNFTSTPDPPSLIADDSNDFLSASHPLGVSEILVSFNNGPFISYNGFGRIYVGDYSRPKGYWKFKIRSAYLRNESAVVESPAFTYVPKPPILTADDFDNTLEADHKLGSSEILVSENDDVFKPYTPINVGNFARAEGYWKFKIKAGEGRSESTIINSPAFNYTSTPEPPTVVVDDVNNFLSATHPLGVSEILVSFDNGPFIKYEGFGRIFVGDYARPKGFWKFKIRSAYLRNESSIVESPMFTKKSSISARQSSVSTSITNTAYDNRIDAKLTSNQPLQNLEQKLTIFPNPITNNILSIQMSNVEDGNYRLCLKSMFLGTTVLDRQIVHSGKNKLYTISIDKRVPSGTYIVEVRGKQTVFIYKVIKM